ncbi:MAG: hypothetical protein U0528_04600 [Anaerolineae bacterium]|nr:hypothetical protein [Anaerolineae bacterium]
MAARIFRVDQPELQRVGELFQHNVELMDAIFSDLTGNLEQLRLTWVGEGARSFFDEMDTKVMPILRAVIQGFGTSSDHTSTMIARANDAEDMIRARFSGR